MQKSKSLWAVQQNMLKIMRANPENTARHRLAKQAFVEATHQMNKLVTGSK